MAKGEITSSPASETARGVGWVITTKIRMFPEATGSEIARIAGNGFTMGTVRRLLAQEGTVDKNQEIVEVNEGAKKMNFGQAIEELKKGYRIYRTGWNGKCMWLGLQIPDNNSKMSHPYVYMSDVVGKLFPWNPNNLDMLATDWQISDPATEN